MKMNNINEDRKYSVYVHINKINKKKYVGITSKKPEDRWRNGWGYYAQPFFNAIQKYGWDNFDHIILETSLSLEDALKMENEKIIEYDSFIEHNGYNVVYYDKKEQYQYSSECIPVYQFDIYGNFIREYNSISSASALNNISSSLIAQACRSKIGYSKGYVWRYKKNIENPDTYKNQFDFRIFDIYYPIYQFDLDGNYICSYENASDAFKKNPNWYSSSILDCCRGKYRSTANYIWKFQIDVPDIKKFSNTFIFPEPEKNNYSNPVLQFDFDGNYINTYNSPKEAALAVGCCVQLISFACIQKIRYAKGFLWRYAKDYNGEKIEYIPPKRTNLKTVYQFDMNFNLVNCFDCASDAEKELNIPKHDITACCNKDQNTAHGFIWSYDPIPDYNIRPKEKAILQYTKDGEFIKKFSSAVEAGKYYGFNNSAILNCCKGRNKTSYGYIWKYSDNREYEGGEAHE